MGWVWWNPTCLSFDVEDRFGFMDVSKIVLGFNGVDKIGCVMGEMIDHVI